MSRHSRAGRLAGRPVLVAESHARFMVEAARAPLDFAAEQTREGRSLLGRISAFLRGAPDGERRSPDARAEDSPPAGEIAAWGWFRCNPPPCAPAAELQEGGYFLQDGVAVIDIDGPLFDRGFGFGDGYDDIARALRGARADDRADQIMIRLSSPGGLVDGLFDLVDEISAGAARQGGKPVTAFVAGAAFSAAYAIAAACDQIVSSPQGEVGSIGAVLIHINEAAALSEHGIEITPIEFPPGKTEGAWFKALSDDARADLDARIKRAATLFIDHVASHRGLSADAIIALSARVFGASDPDASRSAIDLKLIDSIAFERDAFKALADSAGAALAASPAAESGSSPAAASTPARSKTAAAKPSKKGDPMSNRKKLAALKARAKAGDPEAQAQLAALAAILAAEDGEDDNAEDAAKGDDNDAAGKAEGDDDDDKAEGDDDDAQAEDKDDDDDATMSGADVVKVMTSPEAKGREALAGKLAGEPGMTVKRAKALLSAAPNGGSRLSPPDPKVSGDASGTDASGLTGNADVDAALGAYAQLRGSSALVSRKPH